MLTSLNEKMDQKKKLFLLCITTVLACWSFVLIGCLVKTNQEFLYASSDLAVAGVQNESCTSKDTDSQIAACKKERSALTLRSLKVSPKCRELLEKEGTLVTPDHWETSNCKSMRYTWSDLRSCLRQPNSKHTIVLIGDSRLRQLYHMSGNYITNGTRHSLYNRGYFDLFKKQPLLNLNLKFYWHSTIDEPLFSRFNHWLSLDPSDMPDMVVLGVGTWYLAYEADLYRRIAPKMISEYEVALWKFSTLIKQLDRHIPVIWVAQGTCELYLGKQFRPIHNISEYNAIAENVFNKTGITYWKSAYIMADRMYHTSPDNNHYSENVTKALVNILWNFYCNSKLPISSDHCCSGSSEDKQLLTAAKSLPNTTAKSTVWYLTLFGLAFTLWMICCIISSIIQMDCRSDDVSKLTSGIAVAESLLLFTVVICLCYLFDKLFLVQHIDKRQSAYQFYTLTAVIALVAIFTTKKVSDPTTLNREQTYEWKGWMQLIIVAYHVTGTSRDLVVYMNIRFLVSSYLVLTGYGHFLYHFRGGDLSWHRVMKVVVRLNLLTAVLCATMKNQYQFYYFIPLITFWYLVTVAIFIIPPRITHKSILENRRHWIFLLLKLLIAVTVISILDSDAEVFRLTFSRSLWPFVQYEGSLLSWQFRWSLDRFSTLFGIILAVIHQTQAEISKKWQVLPRWALWLITSLCVPGLLLPTWLGLSCVNKRSCNSHHSYTFIIPVISFVALRNISITLRHRYSWTMAWFGRCSLELLLLQHHLWLCDERNNVLSLVENPIFNYMLLASLLSVGSELIHNAAEKLTSVEIPKTPCSLTSVIVIVICIGSLF